MPGNIIKINNTEDLSWYIGDSQMPELIKYLDMHGYREVSTRQTETGYIVESEELNTP